VNPVPAIPAFPPSGVNAHDTETTAKNTTSDFDPYMQTSCMLGPHARENLFKIFRAQGAPTQRAISAPASRRASERARQPNRQRNVTVTFWIDAFMTWVQVEP
jgi:hypothetical protein